MKLAWLGWIAFGKLLVLGALAAGVEPALPAGGGQSQAADGCVVLPSATNAVQLRLYTYASPQSGHLFNTIELRAGPAVLLASPAGEALRQLLSKPDTARTAHPLLVDGLGPQLDATGSVRVIEEAAGPDWRYAGIEAGGAYRGRLSRFHRGILYVAPNFFAIYDHLEARDPASFQMFLHPPTVARVDKLWGDIRIKLPDAGLVIACPAPGKQRRAWAQVDSPADSILPGTTTMTLALTNKASELDMITILGVQGDRQTPQFASKFLESNTAVGARVYRDGLPTLVAFRRPSVDQPGGLTGFSFTGPVGVAVFVPKPKPAQ